MKRKKQSLCKLRRMRSRRNFITRKSYTALYVLASHISGYAVSLEVDLYLDLIYDLNLCAFYKIVYTFEVAQNCFREPYRHLQVHCTFNYIAI